MLLLTGRKLLCCYWQAQDAMLLLTGRKLLCSYWQAEICYVATGRQKTLCCYWQPTSSSRSCSYRGAQRELAALVPFLHWRWYRACNVQWNDSCVARGDTGQFILHCVHADGDKGCSTTRGRWFGSGLPLEERQICCCIRREVKTAHFSLTAVLASSIIRSCDATFLHTPLPHSRFSDLRVTVIWLLRTIIRLSRHTNTRT